MFHGFQTQRHGGQHLRQRTGIVTGIWRNGFAAAGRQLSKGFLIQHISPLPSSYGTSGKTIIYHCIGQKLVHCVPHRRPPHRGNPKNA